jgi:dUTP pyrophosphatase
MNSMTLKIKKLSHYDEKLPLPSYETPGAAGADVRACLTNGTLIIKPGERVLVPTGLSVEIPKGFELQVRPRSGLSLKTNLLIVNAPGTIDSDYRGELNIIMGNFGVRDEIIRHGDRIAQLVIAPVWTFTCEVVDCLEGSARGTGGFGSTGN